MADISVFVEQDEAERRKRFVQFYRRKGFSEDEIQHLYVERLSGEATLISQTRQKADIIIKN